MKKPEYIRFDEVEAPMLKTRIVEVRTTKSGVRLGRIAW